MSKTRLWLRTILGVLKTAPGEHLDVFRQDLVYALRAVMSKPGFAAVAIATLALGIGANTAIFTIVYGVLLRPFPYPDVGRMAVINEYNKQSGEAFSTAFVNYEDWQKQNTVFESMGLYRRIDLNLTGKDQAQRVNSAIVSSSLFDVAGLQPINGRTFTADEDRTGTAPVVVISERLWRSLFASDPSAVGKEITLNGVAHTIVGIMPGDMRIPSRLTDVWVPLGLYAAGLPKARAAHPNLWTMARLKPGIALKSAVAEMAGIAQRLSDAYPDSNRNSGVQVTPFMIRPSAPCEPLCMRFS